jgi:hypothetical protein
MIGADSLSTVFMYLCFMFFVERRRFVLKGPKLEIFGSGVFTQIRPVWVGALRTRPKNVKKIWFWLENRHFVLFSTVGDSAYNFKGCRTTTPKKFERCHRQLLTIVTTVVSSGLKNNF